MEFIKAKDIERFNNWSVLIYSEPGKGKTSMVKSLQGRTLLLSADGMYHVLAELDNVDIVTIDPKKSHDELTNFLKFVFEHHDKYDNIVIDNLSTYQKMWLNERARETTSGNPEIQHYAIIDRIMFDTILSLKKLNKNLLIFAHEKQVEIVRQSGGTYTQFQPDLRNLDAIMGITPIVGRLIIFANKDTNEDERIIVLQPTQATRAKDQLIGDLPTIGQMELLPKLQKTNLKEND
ncbi:AAA family ATPase [Aerococcaceae bacterium DSM 111022]|nr:AAA family ATPase [Aerococcaceae bacterium DSM 111022]